LDIVVPEAYSLHLGAGHVRGQISEHIFSRQLKKNYFVGLSLHRRSGVFLLKRLENIFSAWNGIDAGLSLLFTLIHHENGAFRKRFSHRKNLKTRFRVNENTVLKTEFSENNFGVTIKRTLIVAVINLFIRITRELKDIPLK